MVSFKHLLIIIPLAFIANRGIYFFLKLNFMKFVYNHEPGPCHQVPGVEEGSEDIQVLRNGIALITSGLRFPPPGNEHTKSRKGRILKFDFKKPEAGVEEVKIVNAEDMLDLNPHGLYLWEDKETGQVRLFLVNHPVTADVDYISIFDYDVKANTLRHLKSITHPDFALVNDVVATGPESFYVTNYHSSRTSKFIQKAEFALGLKLCSIVYYDGHDARKVETGLLTPNGINISPDGKFVYVALIMDQSIRIYQRNADNSLTAVRDIQMDTAADNINVDIENGDLWTGGHPQGYKTLLHLEDPSYPVPSQVLRIRLGKNEDFIEEVLSEPCYQSRIYATTVAERYKDAMLVGSVQHKMLYCKLKHTMN